MARLAWAMAAWKAVGRMHWLPTWKETPMRLLGGAAGGQQQAGRLVGLDAELAGQRIGRAFRRHRQADDQGQVVGAVGRLEDLRELFMGVEREGLHAVVDDRRSRWRGGSSPGA